MAAAEYQSLRIFEVAHKLRHGVQPKLAEAFQQRLKREHETRFAASHFKPRLDVPAATDNVPRAVRDREAERGASNKPKRR